MAIFRRFDWLSTYCLVDMQKTLARSEADLLALCQERRKPGADHRQADHDNLVKSIRESLLEYSDLAETKFKLLEYRNPETAPHTSLLNLVHSQPDAIQGVDHSWLFKEGDLMTLDPRPRKTHLAKALEAVLVVLPGFIFFRLPVRACPMTSSPTRSRSDYCGNRGLTLGNPHVDNKQDRTATIRRHKVHQLRPADGTNARNFHHPRPRFHSRARRSTLLFR